MTNDHKEKSSSVGQIDQNIQPYVISIPKLVILCITTFGIFEVYWFYRQFKSFKGELNWKITPWIRALFSRILAFSLFEQLSKAVKKLDSSHSLPAGGLAALYFIINAFTVLPVPYAWFSLLTFLPLISVQNEINYYWEKKYPNQIEKSKFGTGNYIGAVVGSITILIALYGTFAGLS